MKLEQASYELCEDFVKVLRRIYSNANPRNGNKAEAIEKATFHFLAAGLHLKSLYISGYSLDRGFQYDKDRLERCEEYAGYVQHFLKNRNNMLEQT